MDENKVLPLIIYPMNNGYTNCIAPSIYGTGEVGATIQAAVNNETKTTKVNDSGAWSLQLDHVLMEGQSYTVTVIQTDKKGAVSPSASSTFMVDTQALSPLQVESPANNDYINTEKPDIYGKGKKGASIEASINGDIYISNVDAMGHWNLNLKNSLKQGVNTVSVVQKEMGNISRPINVSFVVDTISPAAPTLLEPQDMSYVRSAKPTIYGQGEADATINIIVDDKEYITKADKSGDWKVEIASPLSENEHIISTKQKDSAGNISAETVTLFTVDTVAPEAPFIVSPENGQYLNTPNPTISGYGEVDNRVEIKLGGKLYSALINEDGGWSVDITDFIPDGTHTLNIYQIDKSGNYSPSTFLLLKIDTQAPLMPVVLYPLSGSYVNITNLTIKGTGEVDANVEVEVAKQTYSIKVAQDGSWSVTINDKLIDKQLYSMSVMQTDLAGNVSPSLKIKFNVDTQYLRAPHITFPTKNAIINTDTPVLTGTANKSATINSLINDQSYSVTADSNGYFCIPLYQRLPQGMNQVSVTQIDAGNTSEPIILNFNVDTIAPSAPVIMQPMKNAVIKSNRVYVGCSGEVDASIDFRFDDRYFSGTIDKNGYWEMTIDNVCSGIHAMSAILRDPAGNVSPFAFSICTVETGYTMNTDTNPAVGSVSYNPPGPNFTNSTIATLTTNKPVVLNGVTGTVFSDVIPSNEIYTFNFTDLLGNPGFVNASWIDDNPPAVFIDGNGNYYSGDKVIHYFSSNIKDVLLNGVPIESGKLVSQEGYYTVCATDYSGNVSTKSFFIDRTPPCVSGAQNNGIYNTDVTLNFYDNMSGIMYATLNGSLIASGTTLTENESYNLSVCDFGDNIIDLNFIINKNF